MQAPGAESVSTTTNLPAAATVLLQNSDQLASGRERLRMADLRKQIGHGNRELETAARFFLASPIDQRLAGESAGLIKTRLAFCENLTTEQSFEIAVRHMGHLVDSLADESNRSFYAAVLRDPGVPGEVHATLIKRLTDNQLVDVVGYLNAQGDSRDKADETRAFLYLARLSWLGTAEAESLAFYKVPYVMVRGAQDHSASYWNGHQVILSEKMLTGGTGTVTPEGLASHIGTFAHESGHAIFALSGFAKQLSAASTAARLTPGLGSIINEAVAGVMQNRAHVAAKGYGADKDSDANLVLAHEVMKNIVNDETSYANYYHVNTAAARSQMPQVREVLAEVVVPFFQTRFGLLGDPQLAQTLPTPKLLP